MSNVSGGNHSRRRDGVDVAREPVDVDLRQIADERDPAAHVAVERCVAERDLGFVAARDEERAGVVGLRHHQQPADPRLQVLAGEAPRDRVGVSLEHREDASLMSWIGITP